MRAYYNPQEPGHVVHCSVGCHHRHVRASGHRPPVQLPWHRTSHLSAYVRSVLLLLFPVHTNTMGHYEVSSTASLPRVNAIPYCNLLTLWSSEAIIMPYQIIWSWYTGRWRVGCYNWYSEEGTGQGPSPPRPLLAVPNVTAHPSTASVPITVLLYNGPLLCGFIADIKWWAH